MAESILTFIFFIFIVLFVIYSRTKKLRQNFRHNMDEEEIVIEPPKPKARRSLEDTLKALTERYEMPRIEEEENPAENLLQEVRDRRARELAERNKSLKEIPDKKPIIPKLGQPIVESWETKQLREELKKEKQKNKKLENQKGKNYYMSNDGSHFDSYRTHKNSPHRIKRIMTNPNSVRDAFIASEIFKAEF